MSLQLSLAFAKDSKAFLSVESVKDLANFLDIDIQKLNHLLYKVKNKYVQFSIPKKGGGNRKILSPISPLKNIQNKLKTVLDEVYVPTRAAHGYVSSKSIVTNAEKHTNRKYLLNIDLKDFFPSINFGRVYGLFKSYPFSFSKDVATVLAQLCTYENQLPQGAPTSPVISNMICKKLDKDLIRFCKNLKVRYTRYADDLSFSWDDREANAQLIMSNSGIPAIGATLKEIVTKNGFEINYSKINAKTHLERQLVTGIKVNNESLNLRRTFARQIRAMLHAWEKFGYESAAAEHREKYQSKHRYSSSLALNFSLVVKGKLNYMRMVCGPDHSTYKKLLVQYCRLTGQIHAETISQSISDSLWVIENNDTCEQGTAFHLDGYGLITCSHVVEGGNSIYAFRANSPDDLHVVIVNKKSSDIDVALCHLKDGLEVIQLTPDFSWQPKTGKKIVVAGYPNYKDAGDQVCIDTGAIIQERQLPKTSTPWYLVNAKVVAGMSGGPVLNESNKVVGIIVTGAQNFTEADGEESNKHGFVPIHLLQSLTMK